MLVVTPWGLDLSAVWRQAVLQGIARDVRWCMAISGPVLRVTDSRRTYSRRFVEIDLAAALLEEGTFAVLWGLLRGDALRPDSARGPLLDRAIALSEQHRIEVRGSLQSGVREALSLFAHAFASARAAKRGGGQRHYARAAGVPGPKDFADESLIVIYRLLFLLFAEARGLVPKWHPVYRDSYTIESLRSAVEGSGPAAGLWEALQAISRLAQRGCHAGSLRVVPFNGALFSPAGAPLADSVALDDRVVKNAVLALTTRRGEGGRQRIAYADLGVEQLGGVYEQLLDVDVSRATSTGGNERRKATGSFYTPRSLTEYVVRRTLAPLVQDATPEQILALRVLDPAMGSGAFLVAACRYLAWSYELALIRSGTGAAGDIGQADRAGFRRLVAQRCLFGVDLNPMAVQLGRLSLWLATLSADRPLTFLDHRLRTGDSLVGAAPWDIRRQPPPGRSTGRPTALPLLASAGLEEALASTTAIRNGLASGPDDTLAQVRAKEQILTRLHTADSALTRWKEVADLWCSGWFVDSSARGALRTAFQPLADGILSGRPQLPDALRARLLARICRSRAGPAVLPLAARVPRSLLRRLRRGSRGSRVRRGHRKPAVGDGARRPRLRGRAGRGAGRGSANLVLREDSGHLSSAGGRPRQPLPAVRRTRLVAHPHARPHRARPAVRPRYRPGVGAPPPRAARANGNRHAARL